MSTGIYDNIEYLGDDAQIRDLITPITYWVIGDRTYAVRGDHFTPPYEPSSEPSLFEKVRRRFFGDPQ